MPTWSAMAGRCTELTPAAPVSPVQTHRRRRLLLAASGACVLTLLRPTATRAAGDGAGVDRAAAERAAAARQGELCSSRNPVGVGLRGEYYGRDGLLGPVILSRIDAAVDFDASLAWPAELAARARSVRWSGWVKPPLSGRYRFHLDVPGATVEVARQRAFGDADGPGVMLDRGRFVPIVATIPHLPERRDLHVSLEWTAPHGARYVVPRALLHLPSETVQTPRR